MKLVSGQYRLKACPLKRPMGNLLLIMMLAVLCFTLAAPAWATSPGKGSVRGNQEEGQPQPLDSVRVTVKKKSLQHLFTAGWKFAVNKETLIVGTDGKEVSLKKMLVPCEVVVHYAVEKGGRTAKRVDIKRVLEGARWQWTDEMPQ